MQVASWSNREHFLSCLASLREPRSYTFCYPHELADSSQHLLVLEYHPDGVCFADGNFTVFFTTPNHIKHSPTSTIKILAMVQLIYEELDNKLEEWKEEESEREFKATLRTEGILQKL